ncbi:MAG: hypothetical protein ACHREM_23175 [Polyangiales bacterium]
MTNTTRRTTITLGVRADDLVDLRLLQSLQPLAATHAIGRVAMRLGLAALRAEPARLADLILAQRPGKGGDK